MNCNFCRKEIIDSMDNVAVNHVARKKGFCNWACWDTAEPIDEKYGEHTIIKSNIPDFDVLKNYKTYCGRCNKNIEAQLTPSEYKTLITLPGAIRDDGRLLLACDECKPMQYSEKKLC